MSEPLLDAWLDGAEFSAQDFERFEAWLRADEAHLRELLQAAAVQEDLRAMFAKPAAKKVLPLTRRPLWLLSAAGLAAALVLLVGVAEWFGSDLRVTIQDEVPPPPTYKQALSEIDQLDGSVVVTPERPDSPAPDSQAWCGSVKLNGGDQGGSLRWLKNFDLQLDAHADIQLNPCHPFATPRNVCSLALVSGTARFRQQPHPGLPANGIDTIEVETPGGTIQFTHADVTLTVTSSAEQWTQPVASVGSVKVSVSGGSVVVATSTGKQTLKAGESITLKTRH